MPKIDPRARFIADTLTSCDIPQHTDRHRALRAARVDDEAALIERLVAVAGLNLEEVMRRVATHRVAEEMAAEIPEEA